MLNKPGSRNPILYKPGLLVEALGITREQFRYWRRELDPKPTRAVFGYPTMIAYAVLKELIETYWIAPKKLKNINMIEFFSWFDLYDEPRASKDTVIEINLETAEIDFIHEDAEHKYKHPRLGSPYLVISLNDVEDYLDARLHGWV